MKKRPNTDRRTDVPDPEKDKDHHGKKRKGSPEGDEDDTRPSRPSKMTKKRRSTSVSEDKERKIKEPSTSRLNPQSFPLDPALLKRDVDLLERDVESLIHTAERDALASTSSASTQQTPGEDDPALRNDASLEKRHEDMISDTIWRRLQEPVISTQRLE